jgi:imidazole glycerol-phosphate synthase subunit HisH
VIGVLDIGLGNIESIKRCLLELGVHPIIVSDSLLISKCSHLIMPGVGEFDSVVSAFHEKDMWNPMVDFLNDPNRRFLGICIGMQILFEGSEEGDLQGFSIFEGSHKRLRSSDGSRLPPHMGFNEFASPVSLLSDNRFYYMHSYAVPLSSSIPGCVEYGGKVIAGFVENNNNWGAQFHPERSGPSGLNFMNDFLTDHYA